MGHKRCEIYESYFCFILQYISFYMDEIIFTTSEVTNKVKLFIF